MFEHFGIMDVFSAIRKYIKLIIIILLVSGMLLCGLAAKYLTSQGTHYRVHDKVYNSTTTYYFEPVIKPELTNSDIYTLDMYRGLDKQYEVLLNNTYCIQYIRDKLLEKYDAKELTEKSSLTLDSNKNIDITSFKNIVVIKKATDNTFLPVSVETYDKELSSYILQCYNQYINNELSPKMDWISVKNMGSFEKESKTATMSQSNQSTISKIILKTAITKIIIPMIGIAVCIILFIFFFVLFNPTMNRKSDFAEYGIPVISEIGSYKKSRRSK